MYKEYYGKNVTESAYDNISHEPSIFIFFIIVTLYGIVLVCGKIISLVY